MQFLAISGSLRAASTNSSLLRAAAILAPADVTINLYDELGSLPHFNPDMDNAPPPNSISRFRQQLRSAAGVIISTPEYAHGVPGALKNALDWLVASGELYEKPVALFSASPRATYAHASLAETLNVMTARIISEACIVLPLIGKNLDKYGIISEASISRKICSVLFAFTQAASLQEQQR